MTVSSRTPEGDPLECPLCGRTARLELCEPLRDATCPACGQLLTWLANRQGRSKEAMQEAEELLQLLKGDLLDMVEVVMEFEDEFGISVPDALYEQFGSRRARDDDVIRALSELIEKDRQK